MILLDYKDSRPIYEQVIEKLMELMILGILEEDSQMPSVRSLATDLSINPNTIQRAYGELERRGFIYSVKGRGSFVGSIGKLRAARKKELAGKMGSLAQEGKILGMSREEFVAAAEQAYSQTRSGGRGAENTAGGAEGAAGRSEYAASEEGRSEYAAGRVERAAGKAEYAASEEGKTENMAGGAAGMENDKGGMKI